MALEPDYDREKMVHVRRPRAWRWGFVIGGILLAAALVALIIPSVDRVSTTPSSRGNEYGETADAAGTMDDPRPGVGTTGDDLGTGPGQAAAGHPLVELATLTGDMDLTHLVGRTVTFQVEGIDLGTDVAFWVGAEGHRLLVVPDRDRRSAIDRQTGQPSRHDPMRLPRGEPAAITGVIERVPPAEATYSWNLSRDDVKELAKRDVYVRAVAVRPLEGDRPR